VGGRVSPPAPVIATVPRPAGGGSVRRIGPVPAGSPADSPWPQGAFSLLLSYIVPVLDLGALMAERSISELIKGISDDSKAIAEEEIALAKAEATAGAKNLGIGAGLAVAALFLLFLSSFMVIFAGAAAFHEGLGWPWWGSFLIVFGILAVIAIVLVLVALPLFKKGNPVPGTAIGSAKSLIASVKRALKNPSGPRY